VALEICPFCGDEQATAVLEHQDQLKLTLAAHPARQRERAALKRVARAHDTYRRWEAIEVGSVSCLLLTPFHGTSS